MWSTHRPFSSEVNFAAQWTDPPLPWRQLHYSNRRHHGSCQQYQPSLLSAKSSSTSLHSKRQKCIGDFSHLLRTDRWPSCFDVYLCGFHQKSEIFNFGKIEVMLVYIMRFYPYHSWRLLQRFPLSDRRTDVLPRPSLWVLLLFTLYLFIINRFCNVSLKSDT